MLRRVFSPWCYTSAAGEPGPLGVKAIGTLDTESIEPLDVGAWSAVQVAAQSFPRFGTFRVKGLRSKVLPFAKHPMVSVGLLVRETASRTH